ncbi:MAG: type V CRISPR-associated protein Cas12a/Cpf1 [Alphaproteobacteria bacterium]|nr:type V CRISPR-associated protein Cas12a/Cpf1 [Alphaproteobacteria bacterium]
MENSIYENFTGLNSQSKTLRFELKPIGKTLDNIKSSGIFDRDVKRNNLYKKMKEILDEGHKKLLEESLSNFSENIKKDDKLAKDWVVLEKAYLDFRKSDKSADAKKDLEIVQASFRKTIIFALKQNSLYEQLVKDPTPDKFIKQKLQEANDAKIDPEEAIATFNRFSTFFTGFQENRKNIYDENAKTTSCANRAINENFPKFMECVRIFKLISEKYPQIIEQTEKELAIYLQGQKLKDIFDISNYSNILSQSQIDRFNTILGGIKPNDLEKLRGINEFINLYRQQNEEAKSDYTLGKMPQLYKQMLSDRKTFSFIAETFENDDEVIKSIKEFGDFIFTNQIPNRIENLLNTLTRDDKNIYVSSKSLTDISQSLFGNWDALNQSILDFAENQSKDLKTKKDKENLMKKWMNKEEYSLYELSQFIDPSLDITTYWKKPIKESVFKEKYKNNSNVQNNLDLLFSELFRRYQDMVNSFEKKDKELKFMEQPELVEKIKSFLDLVQDILHLMKPLSAGIDLERNTVFYEEFDALFEQVSSIIHLYNKVRNYITKKPGDAEKLKLKFDKPTLADGWDKNKEKDNLCVLFLKDGNYYLGIMNALSKKKPDFEGLSNSAKGQCYKKVVYKQLTSVSKQLPRIAFSKKWLDITKPSRELIEKYERGEHTRSGGIFNLDFCRELIDFYKRFIKVNSDWQCFNYKFSDTSSYNDISGFYEEVENQGYKLSFVDIAEKDINELVDKGDLFLFQIWNKDFAEGSKGHENMHTLYWKSIFSEENLKSRIFKLNGQAELFFRPCQIKKPYAHRVGEIMINKRDKNGKTIPNKIYKELLDYKNKKENLSPEASKYLDKIIEKPVHHEIVKDKHFSQDKFLFHVPLTINMNAKDVSKFNDLVNETVKKNIKDVCYIGVDRGERNLIYVTLIDGNGKILLQKSFNTVEHTNQIQKVLSTDYHQKLDEREKARDEERKSWQNIENIKELKEGYLSQVVHEITKMVIENNAVVILEDLNFGFKRGRFCIEKQVYQKFEKALIDKLNYLVFKDRKAGEVGGVLKGYQLTSKFESFEKLGKQSGILYYVPAAYTSKIDPTTGFTNLFNTKSCTSGKGIKEFFEKFDSIKFDGKRDAFVFSFKYSNFKTSNESFKDDWAVYSASRRIVFSKAKKGEDTINPTQIIKDELSKAKVVLTDGYDLKGFMSVLDPSKNADFFKSIFYAFDRTLQMRNSNSSTGEDYIESPVLNKDGKFFDSRESDGSLPNDADANGAYHIALKGMYMISNMKDKPEKIEHKSWFEFAQKRNF